MKTYMDRLKFINSKLLYLAFAWVAMLSNAGAGQGISSKEKENELRGGKPKSVVVYTGRGIDAKAALTLMGEVRKT
jgi:hypothetical protein